MVVLLAVQSQRHCCYLDEAIHAVLCTPLMCFVLCACSWLSALESTKWLQHLSLLLKAALLVVNAVDRDHRPVLVHCSDGWDRTPQIVALSKVLLDPYYRTIEVQKTLLLPVASLTLATFVRYPLLQFSGCVPM